MKKFVKNKKMIVIPLALAVLLLAATAGLTTALYTSKTQPVKNTFSVGKITTDIDEGKVTVDTTIHKAPKVVNNRDTSKNPCLVRMRVTISPENIAEKIKIDYNTRNWSYNKEDGFWYYQGWLKVGESTTPLFTKVDGVVGSNGKAIKGMEDFQITLYQEAIQAEAVNEKGDVIKAFSDSGRFQTEGAAKLWALYDNGGN